MSHQRSLSDGSKKPIRFCTAASQMHGTFRVFPQLCSCKRREKTPILMVNLRVSAFESDLRWKWIIQQSRLWSTHLYNVSPDRLNWSRFSKSPTFSSMLLSTVSFFKIFMISKYRYDPIAFR